MIMMALYVDGFKIVCNCASWSCAKESKRYQGCTIRERNFILQIRDEDSGALMFALPIDGICYREIVKEFSTVKDRSDQG